jgi:hypothetical protein
MIPAAIGYRIATCSLGAGINAAVFTSTMVPVARGRSQMSPPQLGGTSYIRASAGTAAVKETKPTASNRRIGENFALAMRISRPPDQRTALPAPALELIFKATRP